ncbi:hypothetical protein BU26DRAFT_168726 [Trematosphaeria pertusa]|uniref:Uncharacterized protein n=1 Tax=Trematosphaeria pertusa TaxID=390896 RepID=A0A6A6HUK8_9PLEO|nr:uncharacterized protein BU26DRAFT_168726 [Trematosphaeria pertusa]KAF2241691.1 hypothetical protein BU26DRAFT_168726 [Trematosphaeria pertusa]
MPPFWGFWRAITGMLHMPQPRVRAWSLSHTCYATHVECGVLGWKNVGEGEMDQYRARQRLSCSALEANYLSLSCTDPGFSPSAKRRYSK